MTTYNVTHQALEPATIEWEEGIGDGTSPVVLALIQTWDGNGLLYGTQPAKAPDPKGNLSDLAVMLATELFVLPPELAEKLPPPQEIPTGAVA